MSQKTTLYLPDDLAVRLRQLARQEDRPQAEMIREALTLYVAGLQPAWPQSIGTGSDDLQAADTEAWLRAEWSRR
ncbi:MAG: ribbon-helix-helix domain-containing protein [Chloroflexi bacterium]|nr:ribbon-helix-helix domain-containing protein [Chloroflexota bacterium]